jgi:hypothetical protein
VRLSVETITPEEARVIQHEAEGVTQRNLMTTHVHRLAHAIRSGQWLLTHQAIAFDTTGRLVDGQHRIAAIVEANMPVEVVVAREVDPRAFQVIDTGRNRSSGHVLQIAGIPSAIVVSSAIKALMKYDETVGSRRSWQRLDLTITNEDVVEFAITPRGVLLRGQQSTADYMLSGVGRVGARVSVMVGLTLIREATGGEHDAQITEFVEKVAQGSMLPVNSPILAYRRWLTNQYPQYAHHERGYAALIALLKTWQDFTEGRERAVLSVRPGAENLPDLRTLTADLADTA